MPVSLIKSAAVDQTFAAIVADIPDHDTSTATDRFTCEYCGGKIEASAPMWFNVTRQADGTPLLDIYGVGAESASVSCEDCGRDADTEIYRAISNAMCPADNYLSGMVL
ncbi:hypothetical protein OG455_39180 [Kitasatospora sp. NBC_01287]|uniref:hypothetical protein n=1 Tax=Kitasatospora sp. NBC_01287 TaxID=2903573 RepID=UPI00225686FD|nr:hypothetical protein [Kitasatospora sp. NBC_01287]MCX4751460.1 hypothetical protein [Kitasatospora sp. NBC_01287]